MNRSSSHFFSMMVATMLFSACVTSSLLYAQSVTPQVRQLFFAAERDQQQRKPDAAVNDYKAILKIRHDIPEVYANLGLIYYAQARFRHSLRALLQAEKLDSHMQGVSLWIGIDYVKLNRPASAIPLLRNVAAMNSTNKLAQAWLGLALWNAGRTATAITQLAKANRLFPGDLNISYTLGESYRKAANQKIERVIAASAGTPLQNQIYGDIYRQQKMWPKAIAHYVLAIQQDPQWSGAHLGIGRIYLAKSEPRRAQREFASELASHPNSATAHALLGESEILQGEVLLGLKSLHLAIARHPEEASSALGIPPLPIAHTEPLSESARQALNSAKEKLETARPSPARSLALTFVKLRLQGGVFEGDWMRFQKAVDQHPRPASLREQAVLAFSCEEYGKAQRYLREWLRLHPRDLRAQYLLAKTYQRLSLQVLEGLMRTHPDSYRSHQLLAETYENRGDDEKALTEYNIVEKMVPDLPAIHLDVGEILWKDGHPNKALKELHRELQIDPGDAEADGEIGTICVEQHEPRRAIPYLKNALLLEPGLRLIHKQLGTAYMIEKDYRQAETELLKAVQHDPDGSAHYELGLVYRAEDRRPDAVREFESARRIKELRAGVAGGAAKEGSTR